MSDSTHGYDALAETFSASRSAIGTDEVRRWASQLPAHSDVLDVGCGTGTPVTAALLDADCRVWAIDASPRMLNLFATRYPQVPVACEAVESMAHFGRRFEGVVAWGLLFLLEPEPQRRALARLAGAVEAGGQLLFTAPAQPCEWRDVLTGLVSYSLGGVEYGRILEEHGMTLLQEFDDEGQNHYFQAQS